MLIVFSLGNCGKGKDNKEAKQPCKAKSAQPEAKTPQPEAKSAQPEAKTPSGELTAERLAEFYEKLLVLVKSGKGNDPKAAQALTKEYGLGNQKQAQEKAKQLMLNLQKSDPKKFKEISTRIQNAMKGIMEEAVKQRPKK